MWREVTEERYDEMLGILPPAYHRANGFLVGEPADHRTCKVTGYTRAVYAAFVCHGNRFYEGPNLTIPEFQKLQISEVLSCAT